MPVEICDRCKKEFINNTGWMHYCFTEDKKMRIEYY